METEAQESPQPDTLGRAELAARLAHCQRQQKDWDTDIVLGLFKVMRHASDATEKDIVMLPYEVTEQLIRPQQCKQPAWLVDLVRGGTRMLVFLLRRDDSQAISVLAYAPEWKHWYLCGAADAIDIGGAARLMIQLSCHDIVSEYNHTLQIYSRGAPAPPPWTSGIYASFCVYTLMRNMRHFAHRDEFSPCLANELPILTEHNRAVYIQKLTNLLR